MSDEKQIKSYVWHGEKCFFVSTITRDSSATLGPRTFNETLAWEFDWEKQQRGKSIIIQEECSAGSIWKHQRVCDALFMSGVYQEVER